MKKCKHNKVKMKLIAWAESSSGCDFEAPKHEHRQGLKESLCCADCGVEVTGYPTCTKCKESVDYLSRIGGICGDCIWDELQGGE